MIATRVQSSLKAFSFGIFIYTFSAGLAFSQTPAAITDPPNGSSLKVANQEFKWTNAGAGAYRVFVGNSVGANDVGSASTVGTASSATIALPTDGRRLYVRMYSYMRDVWFATDTTYNAFSSTPMPATISTPINGSNLAGWTQSFFWNNVGAVGHDYVAVVGSTVGADDLGYYSTPGTSITISGLPTDGRKIYVRLYSFIGGDYQLRDFSYTAFLSTTRSAALDAPW